MVSTAPEQDPPALTSEKNSLDMGRLVRLTSRHVELLLGCEESILSFLLLPPFVPGIDLGLTRGPVVLEEHLRCSSCDRWSRKVPRLPSSHFPVRPSIASSTFRCTPVFDLFCIMLKIYAWSHSSILLNTLPSPSQTLCLYPLYLNSPAFTVI